MTDEAGVALTVLPVNDAPEVVGVIPDQALEAGDGPASPYFQDRDGDVRACAAVASDAVVTLSLAGATLSAYGGPPGCGDGDDDGAGSRGADDDAGIHGGDDGPAGARRGRGHAGREESRVRVAGMHLPLGADDGAEAGRALADGWITRLACGMTRLSAGRAGMGPARGAACARRPATPRVTLRWAPPADDDGTPVTDQEVRHAEDVAVPSGAAWRSAGTDLREVVTGLRNSRTTSRSTMPRGHRRGRLMVMEEGRGCGCRASTCAGACVADPGARGQRGTSVTGELLAAVGCRRASRPRRESGRGVQRRGGDKRIAVHHAALRAVEGRRGQRLQVHGDPRRLHRRRRDRREAGRGGGHARPAVGRGRRRGAVRGGGPSGHPPYLPPAAASIPARSPSRAAGSTPRSRDSSLCGGDVLGAR